MSESSGASLAKIAEVVQGLKEADAETLAYAREIELSRIYMEIVEAAILWSDWSARQVDSLSEQELRLWDSVFSLSEAVAS